MIDIAIIGSGPSGAQAAAEAIDGGASVTIFDVGIDAPSIAMSVPVASFTGLRHSDPHQRRYFLGEDSEYDRNINDRVGAHFTPPRAYIKSRVSELAPIISTTFFPEQSLALGGLGAGWGSGCQTFEPFELQRAGLPASEMPEFYDSVARDIGVSGAIEDDTGATTLSGITVQRPAEIDLNAASILSAYEQRREIYQSRGFLLGRAGLATLTEPLCGAQGVGRSPNPYFDMDFYTDFGRSVYRPKFTIEALQAKSSRFKYRSGVLLERFRERDDCVCLILLELKSGRRQQVLVRRLILAANPLNSARIVLRSYQAFNSRQPLLCNPYHYIAAINLRMLGRAALDRRHSLAQLIASYTPAHRGGDHVFAAFFSYRSLMHFRLIREMPLPTSLGLLASRALQTSLTILGVHHPEVPRDCNWIRLVGPTAKGDFLEAQYFTPTEERANIARDLQGLRGCLRDLRVIPFSTVATPPGSSIHYAGTIPFGHDADGTITTDPTGRISRSRAVYIADASPWKYLPAKGPTFTLMANARRIARTVLRSLSS